MPPISTPPGSASIGPGWHLTYDGAPVGGGLLSTFSQRSLADWGIEGCILTTGSLRVGQFTCRRPVQRIEDDPIVPYGGSVFVTDHTGRVRFRGARRRMTGNEAGAGAHQQYHFADAWWDLTRRKYEQLWTTTVTVGNPSPPPATLSSKTTSYNPHLILCYGRTVAEEIAAIINYAASQGVAIVAGTIVAPVYPPTDEVICRDCASIITQLMTWAPGNVCWIDYSTAVPTFHCVPADQLTAKTLAAFGPNGSEDLTIEARDEDVASCVAIRYERIDRTTVDGVTRERPMITTDVFPEDCTGREEGAFSELVTLAGSTRNTITADLTVGEFPANFENAAALESFWKQKILNLHLDDTRIDPATLKIVVGSYTAEAARSDDEDPAVLVSLPRYLIAGQIAPWMKDDAGDQIVWQKQKHTIKVNYTLYADATSGSPDAAKKAEVVKKKVLSVYLTATNAPDGYNTFSHDTAVEEAEQPLTGLAEYLYNQLSGLSYEGERRQIQTECDGLVGMGHRLNLTGGLAAWATMNALIQTVTEDIDNGMTTIGFGVANEHSLGLLITLDRAHRRRRRWTAATQQATGEL